MSLPIDLISEFVKATKDDKPESEEITVYGTTVEHEGRIYAKLDGSELLTPIATTTNVVGGERVLVQIKHHTATVIGNLTSPSARVKDVENMGSKVTEFEIISAYRVTTEDLESVNAIIDDLKAKVARFNSMVSVQAEIEDLRATYAALGSVTANDVKALDAEIENLRAKFGDFAGISTEDLDAMYADIDNLKSYNANFTYVSAEVLSAMRAYIKKLDAEKLSAVEMDANYANIDFTNITKAAIEHFYATSGLIKNVTVGDQTITGELVGVTIKGDLIEAGTLVADKLVMKGEDGLYYKLNTDGVTTEAEQTEYNSLDGQVIKAKSITATKVDVSDLVAFDATIGGFHITEKSLYSGVKESVDNTTHGIYLDSDGQMAMGDGTNFIKYYKDENGVYRLIVSAESIIFAASNKSVEESIDNLIETLSISGRNLIVRRGERLDTYVVASGEVMDCEASYRSATVLTPIKIEGGETYTFSKDESAVEYFRWAWYDKDMNVIGRTADNASVFTWTAPENAAYAIVSYPYTEGSNVKMEKGETATPYSPALEDVNDSITSLGTRIDNIVDDVKAEIDGLEIGGRNLIKNSNFANGIDKWTPVGVTYSIDTDDKHGTYIKITSTKAGYSEQRIYPDTVGNFNHSRGTFTLSFYAKTDEACTLQTNIAGGTTGVKDYELTTEWKKYTHTYDCISTGSLTFWLNDANTTAYLTKIKLEFGDKPTDWTPAPEDMATSDEVEKAQSTADEAKTLSDNAIALIAQLSDSISMLVTDGNGTSLMTQTDDGWTFSTADIMTAVNDTSQGLNDLTKELGDTNSAVTVLQQSVADLGTIADYVKISTYEDEPCIELGEGDSDFKLRITNTRMIFTEGSEVLAYFNNQSLHIKKAVVEEELQQGGFVWKIRSNGNLGLVWKGGNS